MKITFLGTGMLTTNRKSTSFVVDNHILFDIGSRVTDALIENNLDTKDIDTIVVSHHHVDHFGDILYFITRRFLKNDIKKLLTIIGPLGTREKIEALYKLMNSDVRGGELLNFSNLKYVELKNNEQYSFEERSITAFQVLHGKNPCNGYIVTSDLASFGYSGDSGYTEEIISKIPNVKNWILEANDIEELKGWHIGFKNIEELAGNNKDKNFYIVHRKDKKYETKLKNIFIPNDGQTIIF